MSEINIISDIVGKPLNYEFVNGRRGQIDYFIAKKNLNDYFGYVGKPVTIREGLEKYYKFRFKGD